LSTEAGANDASSTEDGASAEGGAGCAGAYQLCDDFEGTPPGMAPSAWTFDMKGGYLVELSTTQAHSGTHSVHVHSPGGGGLGYIVETKTFPETSMDFWGRAYLWMMAAPSGHEVFVAMDSTTNDASGEQVRMLNDMGGGQMATNRRSDDQQKSASQKIPMGTWFCFEWHESPNALTVYLNGTDLTGADETWTEPALADLRLGFERFDGGSGGDIYIDDVAVNTSQIGCN
jgi:hypothetical protein